ncbi:hypothetical protein N473_07100 [Pseudoalteromonas luteoviolacea CPMOR-1]|uniref:Mor transcription activator domain-containing protein n=1 Tax=Pseudoalteromonas luteoviolacea CPMOR-1 TaxID=1365248 RepID=A0A161YCK0_9GAMM|nr:Mor transcription activator family protein [Pseudoalteromonas luteoviolacea]KZN57636.1 hypothetical protein N473_07100 [Pseudoalteromonas luteoviolacea CPMOR-1]
MSEYGKATDRGDGMLLSIFEVVTRTTSSALGEDKAAELGRAVIDRVRHTFGGEVVYVCQGRSIDATLQGNKMWAEFTGNNHIELSKKYGCSVQWVYKTVSTMTKLKRDENQADLFDSSKGQGPKPRGIV